jgi:large subunit ribosomal protein L32
MAVPKKKTSKSKRNMRRSHHALGKVNVIVDKDTGEYRLPHHIDSSSGVYNARQIIEQKIVEEDSAE